MRKTKKLNKKNFPKVKLEQVKQAEQGKGRFFIKEVWQLIKIK